MTRTNAKKFYKKVAERMDKLDAEDRRRQFQSLVDEIGFLESVFNTLSEGILVVNAAGLVIFSNVLASSLASLDFSANLNKNVRELLPNWPWDRLLWSSHENKGWARKISSEIEVLYPEHRILELSALPKDDATVVIVRDCTHAHAHEEDARESVRTEAIQDLAASLAHEMGNPLNALSLNLQLMARSFKQERDETRRARLLADVTSAQKEIARIIEINRSFLSAMRPVSPKLMPGTLADPLKDTLAALKSPLESRRIHVVLELPTALPLVALDRAQMEQVFFNLVKNALEAMKDGDSLVIALSATDDEVLVSFQDTGRGMDETTLAALFEPYRTTKAHGTGLGLMLSRRIVRAHGGEIDVSSCVGEGTQFVVRVPRLEKRVRRLT